MFAASITVLAVSTSILLFACTPGGIAYGAVCFGIAGSVVLICEYSRRYIKLGLGKKMLGVTLGFLVLLGAKICWFSYYAPSSTKASIELDQADILARRAYLIEKVLAPDFGLKDMPQILPETFRKEWAIVTLSMTTAALTNIAFEYPETHQETIPIVQTMIERFLKPDLRSFETDHWGEDALESLDGPNGQIGYLGHLNFMLGNYCLLSADQKYTDLHRQISVSLARRILASKAGGYLETFPDQIFVPDNAVVLASLALFDRCNGITTKAAIDRWVKYTQENLLDPSTGLVVTWVSPDGAPLGIARGSYAGWNSFYFPFFSPELAADQYSKLSQHLTKSLPFDAFGVLEYPVAFSGPSDIDSGPVIFGLSTSGTGFAIAGARYAGDSKLYWGLLRTAEMVGTTISWRGTRRYLFAPLVGDAIILAMKTARPVNKSKP